MKHMFVQIADGNIQFGVGQAIKELLVILNGYSV